MPLLQAQHLVGIIRCSNRANAEWLRNVPNLRSKPPLDLNAKVQRGKRKRRQREKTGPRCVILTVKPVQRPGLLEIAGTSRLSTNSTRKTPKAPDQTSPALSLERIFITTTLVEEALPPQQSSEIFSEVQKIRMRGAIGRHHACPTTHRFDLYLCFRCLSTIPASPAIPPANASMEDGSGTMVRVSLNPYPVKPFGVA